MKKQIFFVLMSFFLFYGFSSANLLQNPSFDSWLDDSTPSNWVVEYRTYAGVFKEVGTIHTAPFSVKLERRQTGTGNNKGLRQRIPVTPGISHTLNAWLYDSNDQANGGIVLSWRNADSVSIGSTTVTYTSDTSAWQLLTVTGTAPNRPPDSVAAFVDVLLRTYSFTGSQPGGFIFVDDADFDISAIEESKNPATLSSEYFVNSPNPFASVHHLGFKINNAIPVRLSVYDNSGELVKTLLVKILNTGSYCVSWDGTNENCRPVSSGIYYGVLVKSGYPAEIKKIVFRKN
jgi:hypothetical protein